jgi:hypothetical protein
MPKPLNTSASAGGIVDPATDCLRVGICPNCGYSLTGLNDEGICPECGSRYTQSEIVLHGAARGSHAAVNNTTLRVAAGLVLLRGTDFLCLNPVGIWIGNGRNIWIVMLWLGAGLVITLGQRFLNTSPGLVRVRLCAAGCFQDDAPSASPVFTLLYYLWIVAGVWCCILYAASPWVALWAAPVALSVAIWAAWKKIHSTAARLAAEAVGTWEAAPFGKLTTAQSSRPDPVARIRVAWSRIHDVDVLPIRRSGRRLYRIRIFGRSKFLNLREDVVDIETALSRKQAVELVGRVKAWGLAARGVITPSPGTPGEGRSQSPASREKHPHPRPLPE